MARSCFSSAGSNPGSPTPGIHDRRRLTAPPVDLIRQLDSTGSARVRLAAVEEPRAPWQAQPPTARAIRCCSRTRLKHLVLKNRLMSTAHEPNYAEDGLPKDRYRLYHVEKAKGGIALTMTAGSAVVSRDSAPAFGNLSPTRTRSCRG
jgi:hypothetical protein